MAEFRIDQATPGAGTPGRARHDLVAGEIITLTATDPAPGAGVSYQWEILDKVGSQAVLSGTTGSTVTIGAGGAILAPCAFFIRLTADDNGTITVTERVCSVRATASGLRVPVFAETANALATLLSNNPDESIDNAVYTNRAGLGSAEQNWRGWAEWAYEVVTYVEALAVGGGTTLQAAYDAGKAIQQSDVRGAIEIDDLNLTVQANVFEIQKITTSGHVLSIEVPSNGTVKTVIGAPDDVSGQDGGIVIFAGGKGADGTGVAGRPGGSATLIGGGGGDSDGSGGALGGPALVQGGPGGSDSVLASGANGAPATLLGGEAGWPGFGNSGLGGDARVDGGEDPSASNNGGRVLLGDQFARQVLSGHSAAAGAGVPWTHQGSKKIQGPASLDVAGTPGLDVEPQRTETDTTVVYAVWQQYNDTTAAIGGDIVFCVVSGNPNGDVLIGDPGSLAFDPNTGDLYKKTANPSTWNTVGGGLQTVHFVQNGPIGSLPTPTDFTDGLKEIGVPGEVTAVILSQEIDGGGGTTDVELYKVSPLGVETQITTAATVALAAGGGAKARVLSTSFIGTNNQLVATDRLGIKLTSVQSSPAADVTVTVLVGGTSLDSVGLPEDDEVTQALLRTVTGTTFENIGTIYLPAGTILASDSRVFMGVDNGVDNAELEIRDAVSATLIATITANGLPADTQPGGNISIPTDGWYSLRLRADTVAVQATLFGLKFVYAAGNGTRIRQAIDAEVTGTTFENVGAVYLPTGTLQAPARIFAGATTAGPDAAIVELRRETGGALIASWTVTGTLAEGALAAPVTIPADDWYNIRLAGNSAPVVALLKGIDWTVLT